MKQPDRSLDAIASALQTAVLPDSAMLRQNMLHEFQKGDDSVTQQRIVEATRGFAVLSDAVMPSAAIGKYVRNECDTKPLPELMYQKLNAVALFVPGWGEYQNGYQLLPENPTIEERAYTHSKFTQGENKACLRAMDAHPDLVVSLLTLQTMIDGYFQELAAKIPPEKKEIVALVKQIGAHWSEAANFIRIFTMAIFLQKKNVPAAELFNSLTQEDVTAAFEFLVQCKAFEATAEQFDGKSVTAKCPVQGHLKEIFVGEGCLMSVVEKLRTMRSQADIALYVGHCAYVRRCGEILRETIDRDGTQGLTAIQDAVLDDPKSHFGSRKA